ncbi:MAG TPA: thioesterase family protein [Anaerolineaceae bacterium]|jgi:acyl-CoA thioester hydrolase|nr:acyl-CoA thioesterase [Anaerolineaceae bacterium]HOA22236.1 thioesterase family protein [Anaerolineaceae bacterium]HOG77976.1 thioesterase family protein [Anaerolineaceae bacterium]
MTTLTPAYPKQFTFYHPIAVRYADLDTHRHVNNISLLEYVETARTAYYQAAGIWDGVTVENMGMVVASVKCDYLESICFGQSVRVGLSLNYIGTKSLRFRFQVEDELGEQVFARGEVVMVSYDHFEGHSRPVSAEWRQKLAAFENREDFLA